MLLAAGAAGTPRATVGMRSDATDVQRGDLTGRQLPPRPFGQRAERQWTDADAHESQYGDIERLQHPTDLPVLPFDKFDQQPSVSRTSAQRLHPRGTG